jgi:predicted PurR-regulated permease PerM
MTTKGDDSGDEAGPPPGAPPAEKTAHRFFLLLLAVATVLVALVVRPLGAALFMAAVLAGVLYPLHRRLTRKLRGRARLSAGLLVAGVAVLLAGPIVWISAFVVKEASEGVKYVRDTVSSEGMEGLIKRMPAPLQRVAQEIRERLPEGEAAITKSVEKQVTTRGGKAVSAVGAAVMGAGSLLFQVVMSLIALFFLIIQGADLVAWLDDTLPLRRGQTLELLAEFKKTSYSVLMSSVITAAVQAAAALIGYFIARVPHPVFFGAVTFFVAFIPAVGAASVCLAAAALLLVTGHPYYALFLAIWGLVIVGLVDNIVKPLLIKGGMEMHGAVVFFALIGGLSAFGTMGLLLGPLVISLFLALLRMYRRDFSPRREVRA